MAERATLEQVMEAKAEAARAGHVRRVVVMTDAEIAAARAVGARVSALPTDGRVGTFAGLMVIPASDVVITQAALNEVARHG